MENKPWGFAGAMWGADDAARDRAEEAWKAFHRHANEIRASAKLLCLTIDAPLDEDEDDDGDARFAHGWARARMWEQYAEGHSGVCLAFRRDAFTTATVGSLNGQGLASPYYGSLTYSGAEFAATRRMLDLRQLSEDFSAQAVRVWVQAHRDTLFFRKAPDWKTDYEYRFVVTDPSADFVFADFGEALEAVILGEGFPQWQQPSAAAACAHLGIQLYRIGWSNGYPSPYPLSLKSEV